MNYTKIEEKFIIESINYFINKRIKSYNLSYTELINLKNKIYIGEVKK